MKRLKIYRYFLWLTIAVALTGTTSCGPKEVELPFETIEQGNHHGDYSIQEPRVVLITSREELDQLEGLVSQAALSQLAELDFQQHFAIAVFRRVQATSGYDVIIDRVIRQGGKIVVYVQFWEPSPHWEVQSSETSPYYLIRVHKDDTVPRETELVLQSQVVTPTPPF